MTSIFVIATITYIVYSVAKKNKPTSREHLKEDHNDMDWNGERKDSIEAQLIHLKQQKERLVERFLNTQDGWEKQRIEEEMRNLQNQRKEVVANLTKKIKITIGSSFSGDRGHDDSIIDVTGQSAPIVYKDNHSYERPYHYDYWKLGAKYREKLKLDKKEVALLNHLWGSRTVFGNIEFCYQEMLRLYLRVLKELEKAYQNQGTTLDKQFKTTADLIVRKQYRYRKGSWNYKYTLESTIKELYASVLKHCENEIRSQYRHKRKLNTDTYYSNENVQAAFEENIRSKVVAILPELIETIQQPDEDTEIELNALTTTRWKQTFKDLCNSYDNHVDQFVESIHALGKRNAKNPSVEHIFFEASKYLARHHKVASLKLYIHYLYHDLRSEVVNHKEHNKTVLKKLFANEEEANTFKTIVHTFLEDKDLEKALNAIPSVYAVKRKKIRLNTNVIKEVQDQHSNTVELLNEYLQESEEEQIKVKAEKEQPQKVEKEVAKKESNPSQSIFKPGLIFSDIQSNLLELFVKSNLSVSREDLEIFATSQGAFKNQLIDDINEICYETIDDVLIEEDGEDYIIYDQYYQTLLNK